MIVVYLNRLRNVGSRHVKDFAWHREVSKEIDFQAWTLDFFKFFSLVLGIKKLIPMNSMPLTPSEQNEIQKKFDEKILSGTRAMFLY